MQPGQLSVSALSRPLNWELNNESPYPDLYEATRLTLQNLNFET